MYPLASRRQIGGLGQAGGGNDPLLAAALANGVVVALMADLLTGLSNNDPVTTWTDFSGNGNSPTQAIADNKPLYIANVLNGLPIIRGDGSNDYLQKAFTCNQPFTDFIVFKINAEGNNDYLYDGNTLNSGAFFEAATAVDQFRFFAGADLNIIHPAVADFAIACLKINGASSKLSINAINVTGNAGATNPGGLTLFNSAGGIGSLEAAADIYCFLRFPSALSNAAINFIGALIATKTGLTWTNWS